MLIDSEFEPSSDTTTTKSSSMSSESCSEFPTSKSSPENNLPLKPHRSSDSAYSAIRTATVGRKTGITFRDFDLHRRIGAGDIGTVYLCSLNSSNKYRRKDGGDEHCHYEPCLYAMKVVNKEVLAKKKKVQRAEMEKKILKMLDHPFLPTLYAEFEALDFSCIVMEYCSGGDLHSLRHKQPHKHFSLSSARFYAAEVLVALEYLHMLGIIYRDLKPENVLVRSDGHIMLSDFDLSLCSEAIPAVESPSSSPETASRRYQTHTRQHSTRLSCFLNRLFRSKKIQALTPNRRFIAEPVSARSCSFVGTHEYISPEVASGGSHGSAVDWWSFGIFLYEMIYGRTPFADQSNENTLRNIVKKPLTFPTHSPSTISEFHARDLISGLLNKDPSNRLGSNRGAADVKTHPFFKRLNFALVRSLTPPEIPRVRRQKTVPLCEQIVKTQSTAFDYF